MSVSFSCPQRMSPVEGDHLQAMRAHGHGGYLTLIGVALEGGGASEDSLIAIRFKPSPGPTLGAGPPPIAVARARISHASSRRALNFVAAAISAEVHVELPPPLGARQSIAVEASTHDERIQFVLMSGAEIVWSSDWQGYVNSLDEPKRAPLDLAWNTLSALLPGPFVQSLPDAGMKQLFAAAWRAQRSRADLAAPWVEDTLLELAAALGTPEMAGSVAAQLDSQRPRRRLLAVNALSGAITGQDLRRDAAGASRPLEEIAADYHRLVADADGGAARN